MQDAKLSNWKFLHVSPIPIDILRFRAKTMPQIKGKQQGVSNWDPLKGNRVKIGCCTTNGGLHKPSIVKYVYLYD